MHEPSASLVGEAWRIGIEAGRKLYATPGEPTVQRLRLQTEFCGAAVMLSCMLPGSHDMLQPGAVSPAAVVAMPPLMVVALSDAADQAERVRTAVTVLSAASQQLQAVPAGFEAWDTFFDIVRAHVRRDHEEARRLAASLNRRLFGDEADDRTYNWTARATTYALLDIPVGTRV